MTDAGAAETTGGAGTSWDAFARRLADGLGRMAAESFLILALPADEAGGRAYVQFAHWTAGDGSAGLRAEAVGSENMPETRPLTPVQEERLGALAWARPAPGEACRNFHRTWPAPAPCDDVAALVTETLREVYGVGAPGDLQSRYASFENEEVEDLGLGLEPIPPTPRPRGKPERALSSGQLEPLVEDGLRDWLGVEQLERDEDGDYAIPVGSALVYVHVGGDRLPLIAIFSSILTDVEATPGLFAALNDINRRIRFARAFWVSGTIVVATELAAVDVSARQISFACMQLGSLADHLDDMLHGRFGGGVAFEGRALLLN